MLHGMQYVLNIKNPKYIRGRKKVFVLLTYRVLDL